MCNFSVLIHFITLFSLYKNDILAFSTLMSMEKTEHLAYELCMHSNCQTITQGKTFRANVRSSLVIIGIFIGIVFETWLAIILLCSGDVHPNPGPSSASSTASSINSSLNMSHSLLDTLSLNHNLSFIHYNVQSVFAKLDILQAELIDFDILAFTETWLNPSVDSDDLSLYHITNLNVKTELVIVMAVLCYMSRLAYTINVEQI